MEIEQPLRIILYKCLTFIFWRKSPLEKELEIKLNSILSK